LIRSSRSLNPHLRIEPTRIAEPPQLLEDEGIVDLTSARLEPARYVADLHDLDGLVIQGLAKVDDDVSIGVLQVVKVEAQLHIRMIDLGDNRKCVGVTEVVTPRLQSGRLAPPGSLSAFYNALLRGPILVQPGGAPVGGEPCRLPLPAY
jgi:hypothetical protein